VGRVLHRLRTPRARRVLKVAGLSVALPAALLAALAVTLLATRTYRLDDGTWPGTIRRLVVDAGPGEVSVVGSDRSDVFALWQRRYSLVKPRVDHQVRGDVLALRSRCPATSFRCAVVLGAQLPQATAVALRSRSAPVTVNGLSGPVEVSSQSGAVTVQDVDAPVRVDDESGKLSLLHLSGDVTARTTSGAVELNDVRGNADVTTGAGAITSNASRIAAFTARSDSGWVTAAFDAPPERVEIRSTSGPVTLQVPKGRYRLSLHAPSGQVHVSDIGDDPAAARTITVTSGVSITLEGT
jgi:hypothetical protein